MKINKEIISFNSPIDNFLFFIKEGHIFSHLLDRMKWHLFPRIGMVSSFPTHVDVEISNRCNLNCPMCFRKKTKSSRGIYGI